ncbi:hypothetical protein VitviT2T_003752 [Vitis vinifera]|uniref:Uncharacterized protein n=1 Tax=Vitis vinifera TaxID=29760 RepID=A0ABY9BP16_VITVI|nr:hypothetical protein VitviT2T_003752 [Vitis vinifera]
MEFSGEMNIYRESELSRDFEGEIREEKSARKESGGLWQIRNQSPPAGNSPRTENFDTLSCTLSVHNTSIKLSPMDIELILGLKAKGVEIFYLDHISTKKGMNLRFNAYSPRINEWGDDEVSRMKRKIKTLGGYDDPKVMIWIIKIGQSVDIEQNNGAENENDEKMKVVEKDEITSDHKDNDMRNVEDGDKQDAKVHEQQEEGHKIIPMSILPNVEDSHSLSTLESLVVAYVFDVSLDKSELLVNFQYEHASRADFLTLGPRQELLDVIINVFACQLNSFENKFKGI